jgi:hypothetical protein
MGNIEKINSNDIVRIINNSDIMEPFFEAIFLTQSTVAGTTHIENIKELEPQLKIGDKLDFYRELNNLHDKNAILIKHTGNKIGYIPMVDNEILANLMDAGKLIYGEIKDKKFQGKWIKIDFDIYLDD